MLSPLVGLTHMRYVLYMTSANEDVATRVRVNLALRNEPQAWLALQLGWTEARLSARMVGKTSFAFSDVVAIARAFGLSTTEFLTGVAVAA